MVIAWLYFITCKWLIKIFLHKECQVNTEPKIKLSVYLEVTGSESKTRRILNKENILIKFPIFYQFSVPEVLEERAIASANSFNGKGKKKKKRLEDAEELHIINFHSNLSPLSWVERN